jgi:drug/metabolite transporter (DMT)-like permease
LDVRLFKTLVLLAIEAILWMAVFIYGRFAPSSELSGMFIFMLKLMIYSVPVFFICPKTTGFGWWRRVPEEKKLP